MGIRGGEDTARNKAARVQLVDEHGVQLRRLPDDVLIKLKAITGEVLDELVANDPLAKKARDSQKAFQAQVTDYHEISEEAYYRARRLGTESTVQP